MLDPRCKRRGLTLLELLLAMTIMAMVVGTLGTLAQAVRQAFEYNEGQGIATQHARVALDRIVRTANEATANANFPGFLVLADTVGSWRFPDTVVIWYPTGAPVDPTGLPRYKELVIYCPSAYLPNQLLEITVPSDSRTVPPITDQAAWATAIAAIKKSSASNIVVLTNLLRVCDAGGGLATSSRGAVRFATRLRPSESDWARWQAGTLPWAQMPWVQGIYGTQSGLRQSWLRMEFQLVPNDGAVAEEAAMQQPITFFGSAARYYQVQP